MNIFPVFIPHAGCPHHCLFCAQDKTSSFTEVPSPEEVGQLLHSVLQGSGGEIAFYGGTFTALPIQQQLAYLAVAQEFVSQGRAASIRVSTRPDAVDSKKLEVLRSCGVKTVELGCQSFVDKVLDAAGRGHSRADNIAAVHLCKDYGFSVGVQMMPGLPEDSPDSAMESFQVALDLQPAFLRIYPAVVIAGTGLAKLWQTGQFEPWDLDVAVDICAEMLLCCLHRQIPVIRLGLHNDAALGTNLLAGPYHPAFGQLVRARLWRRLLKQAWMIGQTFTVNPADYSDAIGHRGENRSWFEDSLGQIAFFRNSEVPRGFLRVAEQQLSFNDIPTKGI